MQEETLKIKKTITLAKAIEEIYKPETEVDEELVLEEQRNKWSWDQ